MLIERTKPMEKIELRHDCENCEYKEVTYYESDTGYQEWGCEFAKEMFGSEEPYNCEALWELCPRDMTYSVMD